MDELTKDFLQESSENLDRLDQDFVKLEKEPDNPDLLQSIFRTVHTIKGTCGFLGFKKLEDLAHAGESLLSLLRDRIISLNTERTTALLRLVDATREILSGIETTETEGERDDSELIATLLSCRRTTTKRLSNRIRRYRRRLHPFPRKTSPPPSNPKPNFPSTQVPLPKCLRSHKNPSPRRNLANPLMF